MKKEEYLNRLTQQIRCQKAREPVRREICQHIEEQTEAYVAEGMAEEDAMEAAVQDMGDPVEAGNALDRIHRPQMAWRLIALIGILGAGGVIIQCMIRLRSQDCQEISGGFVIRQIIYFLFSFIIMTGVCYFDYSRIGCYAKRISLFLAVLLGIFLPRFGLSVNGVVRWIGVFGVSVNVFTFVLLLVPLYGAILYTFRGQGYKALIKSILWMIPGLWIAVLARSVSTFIILSASCAVLFSVAVYKNWFCVSRRVTLGVLWSGLLLFPVIVGRYILNYGPGYQADRIRGILHPAEGSMIRMIRSLLEGSRWIGAVNEKLSSGMDYYYDYALTYIITYYGILAGVVLAGLILFLFGRFMRISLKQKNQLGMIMGMGCSLPLLAQLALYLMNNLGICTMEVYCPFFNCDGGSMLAYFMMFGLLLSIHRYEKVLTEA